MKKTKKNPYKAHLFSFKCLIYDIARWSGWPFIFWFRLKKIYQSKEAKKYHKGGAIVICNHILYSDIMIIQLAFWYRRIHSLAMKELFSNKIKSFFFKSFFCIPIDRERFSMETFKTIVQKLEGGNTISMFPEGHISWNNDAPMSAFKSGMILMALQSGAKIIPCYRELRAHWWQREKIVIGDPIDVKALCGEKPSMQKIEEVTKLVFENELKLKEIYHGGK